ncbi:hypothetical protein KAR91_73190 [Candidatus Pacearchaeota archaeon]|nr:hypothetical protein [Candidatus Pacearchaeota archaeon]
MVASKLNPLCECGCGKRVSKAANRYILGHYKKKHNIPWNKGIPHSKKTKFKMSKSAIKKFKDNVELRKKCGWKKFTLSRIHTNYKFLLGVEECRDHDNELQFRCKYCNEWFTPTSEKIGERIRALKQQIGLIHNYLYCCTKCKMSCRHYNRHSNPDDFDKLQEYRMLVYRETANSISKFRDQIFNLHKRSKVFELDHKYSVYEGFVNNIDPKIIGHYKNLQMLTKTDNLKKGISCSITLSKLLKEIKTL